MLPGMHVRSSNEGHAMSVLLLLLSPICWASWLNFKLICRNWRFESFYINYALTIVVCTFTFGSVQAGSPAAFLRGVFEHGIPAVSLGTLAGVIWGIGNILLVAAITLCGLAVGLKIAIGLSLVLGVVLTYIVNPSATENPLLLALGVVVIMAALILNGTAYRVREESMSAELHQQRVRKGLIITVVCGILIGVFPLLQGLGIERGLDGIETAFLLTVGNLFVSIPLLPLLIRRPLIPEDQPDNLLKEYRRARPSWHLWAALAGVVWAIGTISNLIIAVEKVGLSIAWAVGECSPLVGLLWGVFVFKEFSLQDRAAQAKVYRLLAYTLVLYLVGLGLVLMAA